MQPFLQQHSDSGELTILILGGLVFIALLVLVPQLLRSHQKAIEMAHEEHMRALERGLAGPLLAFRHVG